MRELTETQKYLIRRLKSLQVNMEDTVGIVTFLETEAEQLQMIDYLHANPKATPEQIKEKLRIMLTSDIQKELNE